jgi:protein-disulfide isomerase
MVKVFLSHQSSDAALAASIAQRLHMHGIQTYLDVIDPYIGRPGEDLAAHIRVEMGKCTQLLAVISEATKASQWVPWEIGVATEKDYPLATYAGASVTPPEFLRKWPYLRSQSDLDLYASLSKKARDRVVVQKGIVNEATARMRSTADFFSELRRGLGQ